MRKTGLRVGLAVAGLFVLSACDAWMAGINASDRPVTRVARVTPPDEVPPRPSPSVQSQDIAQFYARVEQDLLTRGLLRADGGGPDAPYDARMVGDNFVRIALSEEFRPGGTRLVRSGAPIPLSRWEEPVRFGIEVSARVPGEVADKDRQDITGYVRRLSRITRLPMFVVPPTRANFHVLILDEDDRRNGTSLIRNRVPSIDDTTLSRLINLPRSTQCVVVTFARPGGALSEALAIIRAEHPPTLRLSCIHEELAQGLGLVNDSPTARPSIFNDDEEFGLLTSHDEILLKILYDQNLRPGMSPAEAAPIARMLAAEFLAGAS